MMSKLSVGVKTQMQQSKLAFEHVINELLKQELDGPIALSLLQYTGNTPDIELVLDMTDDDICDLHYFVQEVDTPSAPSKKEEDKDGKSKTVIVRRDLPRGYKRLLKIFVSFHKHLRAEGVDIYFDWTNIDLKTFTHYSQYPNITTPTPDRLSQSTSEKDDSKPKAHKILK